MYWEWIVDLSRILDYLLFLNICSVSSWLKVIEYLLVPLYTFYLSHKQGHAFSKIISSVWASEMTCLNVKEYVVYVCSLWFIIEWLNAMYIHGFNCCYRPRDHHPTSRIAVLIGTLNNVSTLFGWHSIIARQNLSRIPRQNLSWIWWLIEGIIYVCKRK